MLVRGVCFAPPNLPSRARRVLALYLFSLRRAPQAGLSLRLSYIVTPNPNTVGKYRADAGLIKQPVPLRNRWQLIWFPLFYEASGVLGMQL